MKYCMKAKFLLGDNILVDTRACLPLAKGEDKVSTCISSPFIINTLLPFAIYEKFAKIFNHEMIWLQNITIRSPNLTKDNSLIQQ